MLRDLVVIVFAFHVIHQKFALNVYPILPFAFQYHKSSMLEQMARQTEKPISIIQDSVIYTNVAEFLMEKSILDLMANCIYFFLPRSLSLRLPHWLVLDRVPIMVPSNPAIYASWIVNLWSHNFNLLSFSDRFPVFFLYCKYFNPGIEELLPVVS